MKKRALFSGAEFVTEPRPQGSVAHMFLVLYKSIAWEKRALGNTGLDITALGFGGAELGYPDVPLPIAERLLNGALDAGLNVIDTAECYINSEELIGNTVAGRRSEYFLFTKCGHDKDGDHWNRAKWRNRLTGACAA